MMIVRNEDLKTRHIKIMALCHDLADKYVEIFYDEIGAILNENMPMDSNDILSCMSTAIAHLAAKFIAVMKKEIADKDDTCCTREELTNNIFNCMKGMLNIKEDNATHTEIKRLNK